MSNRFKRWTKEEDDKLRLTYGTIPRTQLAIDFPGRSPISLTKRARRLGLCVNLKDRSIEECSRLSSISRKATYKRAIDKDPRVHMLVDARRRALDKGIEFTISLEDIIIPENCPIFGIPLFRGVRKPIHNSPSLDRKDSRKGYSKENVWVISNKANRIKNDATVEDLEILAKKMREILG